MVQRYELTEDFAGNVDVTPVPDSHNGRWVKYEDYERLKQEFMDYVVIKEKQLANLERALGAGETRYD